MSLSTRRSFLRTGAATLVAASAALRPRTLHALPLGIPLGLQLYSVRGLLPTDYLGTLKRVAALGYQEVESAGFFHHSAEEVRQAMDTAGLRCVSGHFSSDDLHGRLDEIIAFQKVLGAQYIICASPGRQTPLPSAASTHVPLTLADWHWNAAQFNNFGKRANAAGMHFGYHNHIPEFTRTEGVVPYDELLRLTDPALVTFEMDCGWVTVGGGDPVAYLRNHADRISMLHVKDFLRSDPSNAASTQPHSTELGRGTTDLRAIFKTANPRNIKHYFVEQEEFDIPPFEALKIDADYLRTLSA